MVEHEGDAEQGDARRDGGLDRERQLPDGLSRRLDERARARSAPHRRGVAGGEERSGPAVDDGLRRRDDEDEVDVDDGRVDPNAVRDRHEVGRCGVVDETRVRGTTRAWGGGRSRSSSFLPTPRRVLPRRAA